MEFRYLTHLEDTYTYMTSDLSLDLQQNPTLNISRLRLFY